MISASRNFNVSLSRFHVRVHYWIMHLSGACTAAWERSMTGRGTSVRASDSTWWRRRPWSWARITSRTRLSSHTALFAIFANISANSPGSSVIPVSCRQRAAVYTVVNPLWAHWNRRVMDHTVIGTLAVDGWAVTFGTARRGLGGLRPRLDPSSLYRT